MGLRAKLSQYLAKLAERAGVTEEDMIKDIQKGLKDPKDLPDEVVKRYNETFAGAAPESEGAKTLRETIQANEPPKQLTAGVPATASQEKGLVPTAQPAAIRAKETKPLMLEGEVLGEPSPRMATSAQSEVPPSARPLTAEDLRQEPPKMSLAKKVGAGAAGLGAAGAAVSAFAPKEPRPAGEEQAPPSTSEMPSKAAQGKVKSGNKQVDSLVNSSAKIKAPDDIAALRKQAEELADQLSPVNKQLYEQKLQQLDQERKDAEQLYRDASTRTEWMEIAEKLGHAFAQMGAAAHGLATGVDLSGLKFDKTDWSKKFDRLMGELESTKKSIKDREGLASEGKKERDKMAESLFDQLVKGKLAKEEQTFRSSEREKEQKARAEEGEKDRQSRERIYGEGKAAVRAEKSKEAQLGALNEIDTALTNLNSLPKAKAAGAIQDLRKSFSKIPGFNMAGYDDFFKAYNDAWLSSKKEKAIEQFKGLLNQHRQKLESGQAGGDTVIMKNPQGQTVKVPRDKVEAAKQAGYTE